MNYNTFNLLLQERLKNTETVLLAKAREYVRGEDRFYNFEQGKKLLELVNLDVTKEDVMLLYNTKHLISIFDILSDSRKGVKYSKEYINEKFGDAINYLIMIEMALIENCKK